MIRIFRISGITEDYIIGKVRSGWINTDIEQPYILVLSSGKITLTAVGINITGIPSEEITIRNSNILYEIEADPALIRTYNSAVKKDRADPDTSDTAEPW